MSLSSEQFDNAGAGLRAVLKDWDAERSGHIAEGKTFEAWLESVQKQGATRLDVYRLVWDILNEIPRRFTQNTLDDLSEIETALTGFCHSDSIIRFPNEPSDADQLLGYVRGGLWK
ncbi:MAG: hypothetical protein ABSF46_08585 [Terriglobia bacterium]|jgi:hypothetical protein